MVGRIPTDKARLEFIQVLKISLDGHDESNKSHQTFIVLNLCGFLIKFYYLFENLRNKKHVKKLTLCLGLRTSHVK